MAGEGGGVIHIVHPSRSRSPNIKIYSRPYQKLDSNEENDVYESYLSSLLV
jgi:hypothetical protein